ncbi:MAG: DUF3240 family protein [Hyphomicrobium sp.]
MRLVKLTLIFPKDCLERVTELLTTMSPGVDHFTTWNVEGNLEIGQKAKIFEQVRGRLDQRIFITILPEDRVNHILDLVRKELHGDEISYWIEAVEAYGLLSPTSQ